MSKSDVHYGEHELPVCCDKDGGEVTSISSEVTCKRCLLKLWHWGMG